MKFTLITFLILFKESHYASSNTNPKISLNVSNISRYHSREALVVSALQVEKHPITTPGPFATPPPQRYIHQPKHTTPPLVFRANSRGGSPVFRPGSGTNSTRAGSPRIDDGFHSSPRPHSSPKLKLRSKLSCTHRQLKNFCISCVKM